MKTGEGKTLTATLPVVLNSLAGKGVHLVTVNDYLARRDAEWMSPIYDAARRQRRRAAEHAALRGEARRLRRRRHLRHQLRVRLRLPARQHGARRWRRRSSTAAASGRGRQAPRRAHTYAIVDEVDNILIDEARTPLIISGAPEQAADLYAKFARLAPHAGGRQEARGHGPAHEEGVRRRLRLRVRREAQDGLGHRARRRQGREFLGIDHLYRAENGHLVNHLIQSLKAESLYKRDVDYAVIDGEVKIIDEFTGRILEGRRWSEGLHQAVEAKEGVRVQEENQTLATITLQNYFRLYDKLAGMTGTALTEATEFMKIYKLGVVQVPTNRPMVRDDRNDQVYKTKDGKWAAVVDEIAERNEQRPAGARRARSPSRSPSCSASGSTQRGIPHTVLNAKPEHAEREGEIVAEAGRPARSRSRRTWPAAASTSSSAATPST